MTAFAKAEAMRRRLAKLPKPAPRTLTESDLAAIRQIVREMIAQFAAAESYQRRIRQIRTGCT